MNEPLVQKVQITRQTFASDQEVRWCPGCGDYAVLSTMQKTLPLTGIPRENIVFVSGIGCSSRFPYYMNTFGFHTLHGRAPTVATGLKLARPDLHVFVVTGDGDGLSIGANHLLHLMRRNINVTVLLFNNRIYGLTKGQFSPTSEQGKTTKSSPYGSLEAPLDPIHFALGANCSFIARAIDVDSVGLQDILLEAVSHQGTSFIEIYQNCNVFNDGAFSMLSERSLRDMHTLTLKPGTPMEYGANQGLSYREGAFEVTTASQAQIHPSDGGAGYVWDLANLKLPDFPVATGIFRKVARDVYDESFDKRAAVQSKEALLETLTGSVTWQGAAD